MRKIAEHLQVLPAEILEEVKSESLKTYSPEELESHLARPCDKDEAFKGLFVFSKSEKGYAYWWGIYEKYFE